MKYIIGIVTIFLIHASCSVKEYVIDSETSQKTAGYTKDCMLIIGKTTKSEIPETFLNRLVATGNLKKIAFLL